MRPNLFNSIKLGLKGASNRVGSGVGRRYFRLFPQKSVELTKWSSARLQYGNRWYSGKRDMEELSKSSDYMHMQNILLQKNQEHLTKQKLLSEATNFYERFKINTKWILIRGNRPFSTDEISTIFSWLIISQILWIVLGTTTFVSLVLFTFNTVFAKEMVGKFVGRSLNSFIDGCDFRFQDALVPEWKKRCISFKRVEVRTADEGAPEQIEFSLQFNQVDITLSLRKWLSGHGLIDDISVYGMKGDVTVKSRHELSEPLIAWFSSPQTHLGKVEVRDSCINLRDEALEQDYRISIYNMELPQLRFEWLLMDVFNADIISGAINHSLFSIHKRQHKLAYLRGSKKDLAPWRRITRLRLDSILIRDLGLHKTAAFNWVDDGKVDIVADLMLPATEEDTGIEDDEDSNKYVVMDLKFVFKDLKATLPTKEPRLSNGDTIMKLDEIKPLVAYVNTQRGIFHSLNNIENSNSAWNNLSNVSINKRKSFPEITVIPSGLKWPDYEDNTQSAQEIIKYHDSPVHNNNEIVLRSRIVKNVDDLKNLMLFRETGIYDTLSMELYVDLMKMVEEWEHKKRNDWFKVWGTTFASQLMILGLTTMV
ncbi:LAMI_0D10506g1_1 [Lachancea mirantina]|uniref:Mitochondrial distribution and morphology protein 32 n=1 Tax=Lachancea mirantina TaxID=1230905 RepID=A0A1G4JE63_9SACH|nr:LAMI_0D10506g1_1 [Lachancea mirantina]